MAIFKILYHATKADKLSLKDIESSEKKANFFLLFMLNLEGKAVYIMIDGGQVWQLIQGTVKLT